MKKTSSSGRKHLSLWSPHRVLPRKVWAPVLILSALAGIVFVAVSYGANQLPTAADELVVEWTNQHHEKEPDPDRLPKEPPVNFRLHGNGLALCGVGASQSSLVRSRVLTRAEMSNLVNEIRGAGFAKLADNYHASELPPAQLLNTISVRQGSALKSVNFFNDGAVKPTAYARAEQIITELCSGVTEAYQSEKVVVRTRRVADARGQRPKQRRNRKIQVSPSEETVQQLSGSDASSALQEFGGKESAGLTQEGSAVHEIVVDQVLPPVKEVASKRPISLSTPAYADGNKKVNHLMLFASDTGSGDIKAVRAAADDMRGWYSTRMSGKAYASGGVGTARSKKTAAQLRTCPSGHNCEGDPLVAIYYNAYNEFYQSDRALIISVAFPAGSGGSCGIGAMGAGFSVVTMPGRRSSGCGNHQAGYSSTVAHEFGHNLGLGHTSDYTLMDSRRACRDKGGVWACTLNSTQRNNVYNKNSYFHTYDNTTMCLEPHPAIGPGTTDAKCVIHLKHEIGYVMKRNFTIDGVYGSGVKTAVTDFQKQRGLSATGKMDATTWKHLHTVKNGLAR